MPGSEVGQRGAVLASPEAGTVWQGRRGAEGRTCGFRVLGKVLLCEPACVLGWKFYSPGRLG